MFWHLWLVVILKKLIFRLRLNVNAAHFRWFVVEEAGGSRSRPACLGLRHRPVTQATELACQGCTELALLQPCWRWSGVEPCSAVSAPHLYRAASDPVCGGSVGSVPNLLLERFKSIRKENVEAE